MVGTWIPPKLGGGGVRETVDPFTKQEMQQSLMLERCQEENPGFNFRDATFNEEVPDPRTFMGGVGYNHGMIFCLKTKMVALLGAIFCHCKVEISRIISVCRGTGANPESIHFDGTAT
jgi:hypothetical protein